MKKKSLRQHREAGARRWIDCYEFCQWSLGRKPPRGFSGVTFEEYVRGMAERKDMHGFQVV